MAADVGKVYPTEFHLLKKELEVQGELISRESLDRKAEIDRLRLEMSALRKLIEQLHPGALERFDQLYAQERESWNPELERPELQPELQKKKA